MSDPLFTCPKCGNTDWFVASCTVVAGPIDVSGYGIEPRHGHGLNWEIPGTALVRCAECGHETTANEYWGIEEEA